MLRFAYPWLLSSALLLLPLAYLLWYVRAQRIGTGFAAVGLFDQKFHASHIWLVLPHGLRILLLLALICAVARPQRIDNKAKSSVEGLDIVLVIDTSSSMLAMDFKLDGQRRNRLQVVKHVVEEFIQKRIDDRIGLVIFGSQAFTQAPLTLDHEVLLQFLKLTEIAMAGPETAIGDGLATAVKRLKDINAKSKIVILMTDGANTAGTIEPLAAMEAAKTLGVKVYTIGVGTNEPVPFPVQGLFGTEYRSQVFKMDEALMQKIAEETGGQYFLASDTTSLEKVYTVIDQLEKTSVQKEDSRPREEYAWIFLVIALILFAVEQMLAASRWRVVP